MLIFGLKVSLIGMGVVFFSLILLVYIIKGLVMVSALYNRKRSGMAETVEASINPGVKVKQMDQETEEDISAVISAAVALYSRNRN